MNQKRMTVALALLALLGCKQTSGKVTRASTESSSLPPLPQSPIVDRDARIHGVFPPGPERDMMRSRCEICHSLDYVSQQRLTEAQWDKTLIKMQKWGSLLTDEERRRLGPFLAKTWDITLPDFVPPVERTP